MDDKAYIRISWGFADLLLQAEGVESLLPVIAERMANIKRKIADPSFDYEEPKDLITWMIQAVLDNTETKNVPPEFLGQRLLFFVSTTQTIHCSCSGKPSKLSLRPIGS